MKPETRDLSDAWFTQVADTAPNGTAMIQVAIVYTSKEGETQTRCYKMRCTKEPAQA